MEANGNVTKVLWKLDEILGTKDVVARRQREKSAKKSRFSWTWANLILARRHLAAAPSWNGRRTAESATVTVSTT